MHSTTIIAALTAVFSIASAVPLSTREVPVVDIFVSEATSDSHAVQVEVGNRKVLIGDNGFAPAQSTGLSVSPYGANIDITLVTCTAFHDTDGVYPVTTFDSANPRVFNGVTPIGSVDCEFK